MDDDDDGDDVVSMVASLQAKTKQSVLTSTEVYVGISSYGR